jgi:hypothetical protein
VEELKSLLDIGLNSGSARANDAFRATVTRAVWIDGRIIDGRGCAINGALAGLRDSERRHILDQKPGGQGRGNGGYGH